MKNYDLAFSMGFSCGGTMALRKAKLQFVSYPLDWVGAPGIVKSAQMIAKEFVGWFEREDLRLVGVRGGSFQNNIYQNAQTRFGYPHDFTRFRKFEELYPEVAEKYRRRVERFLKDMRRVKKVLAVYIERPINERTSDAELRSANEILKTKFPGVEFDLLYFHRVAGRSGFVETAVGEGITAVGCEYAQFDHGEISHAIDWDVQAKYFAERFALAQIPDEATEAAYRERRKNDRRKKFGGKLTEIKYRLYRKLEKGLQERGLVPRDFPLWFD